MVIFESLLLERFPFLIDHLSVIGLILVGWFVEKNYVSRPAIFANSIAVNVYVHRVAFAPNWLTVYANLAVAFGFVAFGAYITDSTLDSRYYDWAKLLYSSLTVGIVIAVHAVG